MDLEEDQISTDRDLDASNLSCPLPLLKAKQELNGMQSGQYLGVTCTDPGSVRDFEVFCKQSGNLLVQGTEDNGCYFYLIRKK